MTDKDEPTAPARRPPPRMAPRRRSWWAIAGAAALAIALVAGVAAYQMAGSSPGIAMPDQGNEHIETETSPHAAYNSDPPTSGPHLPYVAPWGVHTEPIIKELQVHNLEDGGVVIQYNCPAGCADLVAKLRAIAGRYQEHVILAPYPGMKTRIALTAWTRIDAFDDFDEGRIVRFIVAYRGIDHHKG